MIFQIDYQTLKAPTPAGPVEGISYLIQLGIHGEKELVPVAQPFVPNPQEFRNRLDRLKTMAKKDPDLHIVHLEKDGGRGYLRIETSAPEEDQEHGQEETE